MFSISSIKSISSMLSILSIVLILVLLLSGCRDLVTITTAYDNSGHVTTITESRSELPTTRKTVEFQSDVNAVAVSFIDMKTGNFSPYLDLGFFKIRYNSVPVTAGQPYCAIHEEYSTSWWNWISLFSPDKQDSKTNLVNRTTIWIGTVPDGKSTLEMETVSGTGIHVSAAGFKTKSVTCNTQ